MGSKKSLNPYTKILQQATLWLILSLIASGLLLEIYLRAFFPQPTAQRIAQISPDIYEPSGYNIWQYKPNTTTRMISSYGMEYNHELHINNYGLRDNDFIANEYQEKLVIAAIGDSFTFGQGVSIEDAYPKKLELLLNGRGRNSTVINMGRADGAFTTDSEYLYLKKKGMGFRPKLVILGYFVGNDIYEFNHSTWPERDARGLPEKVRATTIYFDETGKIQRYSNTRKTGILNLARSLLDDNSHAIYYLKKKYIDTFIAVPQPIHLHDHPDEFDLYLSKSKLMILAIDDLAKEYNASLIVMIIPAKAQVSDTEWTAYKDHYDDNAYRQNPQELLMSFCAENKLMCIDLLPEFVHREDLYYEIDAIHWNEKGHELAARGLLAYIEENGLA